MKRPQLLQERQKTHGDFSKNAAISQTIKDIFYESGAGELCPVHREVLDMIALKLSRILSGHAQFKDHWNDLSGYSLLAMEVCDED